MTAKRLLVIAVLAVALLMAPAYAFLRGPGPGPLLLLNASKVTRQAGDFETFTWGFPLPISHGPGVMLDVQLIDVDGIDVLGLGACIGDTRMDDGSWLSCGPGLGVGWPTPRSLRPVENLPLGTDRESHPTIVAGVRRQPGVEIGRIGGWRFDYVIDGQRFAENEPFSLVLTKPEGAIPSDAPPSDATAAPTALGSGSV